MSADLLYGEVEEDLRGTVRRVLRDRCDSSAVLARCESEEPYDFALWRTLAGDLGVATLPVPEESGGAGASARELAVVAEEIGRAVAPVPFLGTVLATSALSAAGPANKELIAEIGAGSRIATVAIGLTTAPSAPLTPSVRVENDTLTGSVRAVVDLEAADTVLVPASTPGGVALFRVDVSSPGVTCTPVTSLDLTRRIGTLELSGAPAHEVSSDGEAVLRHALRIAAGVLASEQTGLAQHCLDSTVEYVLTRYQFGRQVGSFQAVKHRLADLWSGLSTARATARNAADALSGRSEADTAETDPAETELAVALAQAYCSDLAVRAAEDSLQLHGGIGMTWEHPVHLYLGRAKSAQLAFGTAERHRARIAELTGLPPA
ncbi:acyl-CoA/acyl-ACP dehydrogenase [Saccharopolyspora sp. HNM0986]|uniref:acyl-CoA dehydrogenase family protein n=1 Tax=Saccharopolyspora galaxeae TaxID=2781241 RepID=UPI00190964A9|nr:acyl-CoA dehydrogenase family protein [Saccharopolyspora sp. HNM0986]MBK0869336.1 acyl-CoA/acyl-ACP dehydrogenase [Saccharopolyspora sp. HNM0986]